MVQKYRIESELLPIKTQTSDNVFYFQKLPQLLTFRVEQGNEMYIVRESKELLPLWSDASYGKASAKFKLPPHDLDHQYRLIGGIEMEFDRVSSSIYKSLKTHHNLTNDHFNDYTDPFEGMINLQHLYDHVFFRRDVKLNKEDKILFEAMGNLRVTNPWRPFPGLFHFLIEHEYDLASKKLNTTIQVYVGRLAFYMIADEAIKVLLNAVQSSFPGKIEANIVHKQHTLRYHKQNSATNEFSLSSLMQYAEHSGYDALPSKKVPGLNVELFDFQQETCQWMLDRERSTGLNAFFWSKWDDGFGQPFYYMSLAGELRCEEEPPYSTGGLLCEEMGLGKTIEVMSTILLNPRQSKDTALGAFKETNIIVNKHPKSLLLSRATLIVVPGLLIPQWWNELNSKLDNLDILDVSQFEIHGVGKNNKGIAIKPRDMKFPEGTVESIGKGSGRQASHPCMVKLPWGGRDRWYPAWAERVPDLSTTYNENTNNKSMNTTTTTTATTTAVTSSSNSDTITIDITAEDDEPVIVYFAISDIIHDHDVVLTTYSALRKYANLYKSIHWHRVILDECQEVRVATNQLATSCANLEASHRWMVSGTPLCNSIEDLHGELRFLRIWPFSLSDKTDGFWKKCIGDTYKGRKKSSLKLLKSLIDVVMMRHSKSQTRTLDNSSLIKLPPRIIEWRGFDLESEAECYLYHWLESTAADALTTLNDSHTIEIDENNENTKNKVSRWAHVKSLLGYISRCITSSAAVQLSSLDHLLRTLHRVSNETTDMETAGIPTLTPEEILQRATGFGVGQGGGLLHQRIGRELANVAYTENREKRRQELSVMTVNQLKQLLRESNIEIEDFSSKRKTPYIDAILAAEENRHNASAASSSSFSSETAIASTAPVPAGLHEEGFSMLYKIMNGEDVQCPLCLENCTITTITSCMHAYCQECILALIRHEDQRARCACCRRAINKNSLMEVKVSIGTSSATGIDSKPKEDDEGGSPNPKRRKTKATSSAVVAYGKPEVEEETQTLQSEETQFIVPHLNLNGDAWSLEQLAEYELSHIKAREALLPSIPPMALHYFRKGHQTTARLRALLADMKEQKTINHFAKFVIFSQHQFSLQSVKDTLESVRSSDDREATKVYKCAIITNNTEGAQKEKQIKSFLNNESVNVILLMTGSGSAGLTLTVASNCYLLEPLYSASEEAQALSRVHRIGQPVKTRCICFYARNTSEERVLALRQQKGILTELHVANGQAGRLGAEAMSTANSSSSFVGTEFLKVVVGCTNEREARVEDIRKRDWRPVNTR